MNCIFPFIEKFRIAKEKKKLAKLVAFQNSSLKKLEVRQNELLKKNITLKDQILQSRRKKETKVALGLLKQRHRIQGQLNQVDAGIDAVQKQKQFVEDILTQRIVVSATKEFVKTSKEMMGGDFKTTDKLVGDLDAHSSDWNEIELKLQQLVSVGSEIGNSSQLTEEQLEEELNKLGESEEVIKKESESQVGIEEFDSEITEQIIERPIPKKKSNGKAIIKTSRGTKEMGAEPLASF